MNVLDRPAPEPDATARYADGETGVVDLFDPAGPPRGAVILLHGGFWRAAYDRRHLRHLAAALAGLGHRVALPEYRRVGDAGGGDPGTFDDARRILRDVPPLLGVDPGDVVVGGHSAGGHLAILAAVGAATPPRRVVALAGVLDVAAAHRARLSDGAVAALLGERDPDPVRIAAIDPMVLELPDGEVVLVHGRRDDVVPADHSTRYAARDDRIRLELLDADHFDVIDPTADAFGAVAAAFRAQAA
ncbi:alpha/beta hydrolase family protein [Pseudolysinimonas sp.]|uniref:alpha/beta hydrolase family protein n=1 Tax=Pseudolysinimonas sp. TaxID=2680009 RepID=UPI003F80357C